MIKISDIVLLMDGTKSPNCLLVGLTLLTISTLTGTLPKFQLPSDTVIQLMEPSDVATNMLSSIISEKDIGLPKTPEQRVFAIVDDNLIGIGIY